MVSLMPSTLMTSCNLMGRRCVKYKSAVLLPCIDRTSMTLVLTHNACSQLPLPVLGAEVYQENSILFTSDALGRIRSFDLHKAIEESIWLKVVPTSECGVSQHVSTILHHGHLR